MMRSLFLFAVLPCALMLSLSFSSPSSAANSARKQKAVVSFVQPTMLRGVTLQGEYLFVHDEAAMNRGEACTFVYKGRAESANKLVASFHCTPAERKKANHFVVRSQEISPGILEVREFQFEGDTESHLVPPVK